MIANSHEEQCYATQLKALATVEYKPEQAQLYQQKPDGQYQ